MDCHDSVIQTSCSARQLAGLLAEDCNLPGGKPIEYEFHEGDDIQMASNSNVVSLARHQISES
mgnify:CR=1 FL=1